LKLVFGLGAILTYPVAWMIGLLGIAGQALPSQPELSWPAILLQLGFSVVFFALYWNQQKRADRLQDKLDAELRWKGEFLEKFGQAIVGSTATLAEVEKSLTAQSHESPRKVTQAVDELGALIDDLGEIMRQATTEDGGRRSEPRRRRSSQD
jgi:hypothetical protein